jgi:hypothetical protein
MLESFRKIPGMTVDLYCHMMAARNKELPKDQRSGSGATTVSGYQKFLKDARKRLRTVSAKKRTGTNNRKNRD